MHAAAGLRASRPWGESRHEGIVKSDKLEIGRILHLKLEIKKSQIGRSEERVPSVCPT